MFQVRIHGRGGQGVVSAAEMLSIAAFEQGMYSQAFPSFGSERMGAPVVSYVRIDSQAIELREPVFEPDLLIIQDPTLFHAVDVFKGLKDDGYVLINSSRRLDELGIREATDKLPAGHVATIPATELAMQYLNRPTPNTVLLGAFSAMTGMLKLASVEKAILDKFSGLTGESNIAAARAAIQAAVIC